MASSTPLSDYVVAQARRILDGETRLGEQVPPEVVHDTRVGVRRLRSTIRVFGELLAPDAERLAAVDTDLRWLAGLLSEVRDADVLGRGVRSQLAELPAELVMGPVAEELDVALAERRSAAVERWCDARSDDRYAATLRTVAAWADQPPVTADLTPKRLRKKGRRLLERAGHKAGRRLRHAGDDPVAVHRARKAVKRQRYAADLLRPVVPGAAKVRKRAKKQQTRLGHHQDLVVEIGFLREQAARFGGQEGHNGFSYGQLRGQAEAEAARIRASL